MHASRGVLWTLWAMTGSAPPCMARASSHLQVERLRACAPTRNSHFVSEDMCRVRCTSTLPPQKAAGERRLGLQYAHQRDWEALHPH